MPNEILPKFCHQNFSQTLKVSDKETEKESVEERKPDERK